MRNSLWNIYFMSFFKKKIHFRMCNLENYIIWNAFKKNYIPEYVIYNTFSDLKVPRLHNSKYIFKYILDCIILKVFFIYKCVLDYTFRNVFQIM